MLRHCLHILFSCCLTLFLSTVNAQSSDELFKKARERAFEHKDYKQANELAKEALRLSPDYSEIQVFLGRLYTWTSQPDSARREFEAVLTRQPDNQEAILAYASLEYWNHNYQKASEIINASKRDKKSSALWLLEAKVMESSRRYLAADSVLNLMLKADSKNPEARALLQRVSQNTSSNDVGISYDFVHFDKQFDAPWQLASLEYTRRTGLGPLTARVNYANRFSSEGLQYEIEAYPRISNTFYLYMAAGFSEDEIFPKVRTGLSVFANLPAGYEVDAGFRLLKFDQNNWSYTVAVGKYYRNYWFNFRSFVGPSGGSLSQSYLLNARYYTGGADDYIRFGLGWGLSPDESSNIALIEQQQSSSLRSNSISLGYTKSFGLNRISITGSFQRQEFKTATFGNQTGFQVAYHRRF